jgi:hypothetical protein
MTVDVYGLLIPGSYRVAIMLDVDNHFPIYFFLCVYPDLMMICRITA